MHGPLPHPRECEDLRQERIRRGLGQGPFGSCRHHAFSAYSGAYLRSPLCLDSENIVSALLFYCKNKNARRFTTIPGQVNTPPNRLQAAGSFFLLHTAFELPFARPLL
jgi:hypothetical protein